MFSIDQARDIEFIAMKGKAVASVLGTVAVGPEAVPEDVSMTAAALEGYFADILRVLEAKVGGSLCA